MKEVSEFFGKLIFITGLHDPCQQWCMGGLRIFVDQLDEEEEERT
jgi:hypothetical protein